MAVNVGLLFAPAADGGALFSGLMLQRLTVMHLVRRVQGAALRERSVHLGVGHLSHKSVEGA